MEKTTGNSRLSEESGNFSANADPERNFIDGSIPDTLALISKFVKKVVEREQWKFTVDGEEIEPAQVADPEGPLAAILWRAEKNARAAFGGGLDAPTAGATLGVQFVPSDDALLMAKPVFAPNSGMRSFTLLFTLEALVHVRENYLENAHDNYPDSEKTASLDMLMREFNHDNEVVGLIPWAEKIPAFKGPEIS